MSKISEEHKNRIVQVMTETTEEVAREDCARTGFDVDNEPHGLFRALASVIVNPVLYAEAWRRCQERLKAEGWPNA